MHRWVFGKELPASQRGKHHLYDSAVNGNASVIAGQKFHVDYSTPGASGYVVTDTVNIGGAIVTHMPVGVATKVGDFLVGSRQDGILGLAFKHGNSSKYILQVHISTLAFSSNRNSQTYYRLVVERALPTSIERFSTTNSTLS